MGSGARSEKIVLGRKRVQEELFDVGTEGHLLARFGLDPGYVRLLVAAAQTDQATVDEMGGSYSAIRCGDWCAHVDQSHERQDNVELYG